MKKDIGTLLKIQEKDIKISSLKKEGKTLPEELNDIKGKVKDLENSVKDKHDEIKKLQVAHKELELDLDSKQENIKKFGIQLFQVKTNEEYKAMQKQINDLKFECGLIEDKILDKMEEIEKAHGELKEIEVALVGAKHAQEKKEKEVQAKMQDIEESVHKIQKERDELAGQVSADFLKKYELIFNNKKDIALVSMDNKACQGCHMALTPNVINEVRRGTKLIICDNCARILYYLNTATE